MVKFLVTVQKGTLVKFAVIVYVPEANPEMVIGRALPEAPDLTICPQTSATLDLKGPDSSVGLGERSIKVTFTLPSVSVEHATFTTESIVISEVSGLLI